MTNTPIIVCLCGSTRFYHEYQQANYDETIAGRIILTVGFYPHATFEAAGRKHDVSDELKEKLDELHLRKIDLADEVFFLNREGYIGMSTQSELAYSIAHHKKIRWLEPEHGEAYMRDYSHELGNLVAYHTRNSKPRMQMSAAGQWVEEKK